MNCKGHSAFSVDASSYIQRSASENAGVEHFETDARIASAQSAARPLTFQLPEGVLPFTGGQTPPFYFGDEQSFGVIRVRRDQIQFDIALPIPLTTG